MEKNSKITVTSGIAFVLWLISMGLIYHAHYIKGVEDELGYVTSDIEFTSEERQYYNIYRNGKKIGYRYESWIPQPNVIICLEENVIKMNLAGLSREIFFQSVVGIDSTTYITKQIAFTLDSGSHVYIFEGTVSGDSLNIEVKKNLLEPRRKGTFIVDENITIPVALPFLMHTSPTETMSFMVFDPVIFSDYLVDCARRGKEIVIIENKSFNVERYDLIYKNTLSSMWIDNNGRLVKANGYMLFGGELGNISIERASVNVSQLPLEVSFGNDILKELAIYPDKPINNPRNTEYLKIELDGIRAANIDVTSSNKEMLSLNPVVFGIYNKPVITGERKLREIKIASIDTSIVGTSDYIQSKDARFSRTAGELISAEKDTLSMARALNMWVFENVEKMSGLDIIRSVDILRERKGDCDEHTKLFTALARSVGIPTQINMGLVYDNGRFRYHSWPSVFVDGVWYDLDPTLGQNAADATHIAFVKGDFEKLVELLRIVGKMSIKVLDYR